MILINAVKTAANYIFALSMPFTHIGGYAAVGLAFFVSWSSWGKHRAQPLKLLLKIFIIYGFVRAVFSGQPQVGYAAMFGYFSQWFLPLLLGMAAGDSKAAVKSFYIYMGAFFTLVFLSVLAYFGLFYKHLGADIYLVNEGLLKGLRSHIAMAALSLLFSFLAFSQTLYNQKLSKNFRAFFAAAGIISLLALALTGSRGYYIAAVLSYAAFGIYWFVQTGKIKAMIYAALAASAVMALLLSVSPGLRQRVTGTKFSEPNVQGRVILYKVAFWEIRERPFFGFGPGEGVKQEKYFNMLPPEQQALKNHTHLHSFYLNFMADFGLAGFVIFILMVFYWLKTVWTAYHSGSNFNKAVSFGLFWGIIGILAGDSFDTLLRGPGVAMELFWLTGIVIGLNESEKGDK